jgi:hypothetical protein
MVSFIAEGEKPEWGCNAAWDGTDPIPESVYQRCAAVFATVFKCAPVYVLVHVASSPLVACKQLALAHDALSTKLALAHGCCIE